MKVLCCVVQPHALQKYGLSMNHYIQEASNEQTQQGEECNQQTLRWQQEVRHSSDHRAELEDRQVHGDDNASNEHAQYDDDEWLY